MSSAFDSLLDAVVDSDVSYVSGDSRLNLTMDVAVRLLDRLGNDDTFRALFAGDARAALREIGYETAPAARGIPGADPVMCLTSARPLASKDQIRAARAIILDELVRLPFHFEIASLGAND